MVTVVAGSETYGAVRKVGSTPVVTKFVMLQLIPLFPLESYYLARLGKESIRGIPLVASQSSRSIVGLRLARVDRLSVVMAYIRFVAAALLMFGFLGLMIALVASPKMPQVSNDPLQEYLLSISVVLLGTGVLIGLPTYYATLVVPKREKRIREICGELLGIAADPAHVDTDTADVLMRFTKEAMAQSNISEPSKLLRNPSQATCEQAALLLLACRVRIASGVDREKLEQAVDSLLQVL